MTPERKLRQDIFIRVCRDSNFTLDAIRAASLAALIVGCHPLEIWFAMPCLDVMHEIATGEHPASLPPAGNKSHDAF